MREKTSYTTKNIQIVNANMNARISLQSKNDSPNIQLSEQTELEPRNYQKKYESYLHEDHQDPEHDHNEWLSKTIAGRVNKSTSASSLNIKMWDRFSTAISPDIRIATGTSSIIS